MEYIIKKRNEKKTLKGEGDDDSNETLREYMKKMKDQGKSR